MTDLTGRLQRRMEGGGAAMLPHLFERPSDPRLGPASPLADFGGDAGDDPFAATTLDLGPGAPAGSPRAAAASASVVVERRPERIVERVRELQPAAPRSRAADEPVRMDMSEAPSSPTPLVAPGAALPRAPEPARTAAPVPAIAAPVSSDMRLASAANVARAPAAPLVAASRPAAADRDVRPAIAQEAPVDVDRPARAQPRAAVAPAVAPDPPVARLEPRPRDPGPPAVVTPEPVAPRVVIGSLHIEVVRAPAPAPARPEPGRREPSRPAASTAAPAAGSRRRTIFGLGQL